MLKQSPLILFALLTIGITACHSKPAGQQAAATNAKSSAADTSINAAAVMARKQVPVICWHQIRDWKATDSKTSRDYIMPIATFKMHIKMLADSGYHTILPDQLYNYLVKGSPLPSKPILLTFDDTDLDQFTIARPELKKYGFKGLFFVMTVSMGKPHYMSRAQVKTLSDEGNVIGSHTWDHHNFKKYQGRDWQIQLDKPTKTLDEITGKKMTCFAYPYGLWNAEGLPQLHQRGFKMAFQLAEKRDPRDPLMTIRRILDSGYWTDKTFNNSIKNSF